MSLNKILKEIDDNQKPMPDVEEDDIRHISVGPIQKKNIIREYLEGDDKRNIASRYGLPTISVTKIIEGNDDLRLETEKRYQSTALSRENYRLSETKNKLLSFIDGTLDETLNSPEGLTTETKLKVLNNIASLFDKLSVTSRLNADKPVNISESRNFSVDVDRILQQLPTAKDKLDFLRGQDTTGNIIDSTPVVKDENYE
jgi:hypothetical protein